ncbi:MAG: hypothetical protein AMJ81_07655 [Phycisphaerae bacterium SM23_33]|nr:MAG: hypothetical protein AMJ81_07655 [Phycisphaerae bacterium SM23_33]
MTQGPPIFWLLLMVGGVVLVGLIAGIVLLVVGLAKKRSPLWATGIVFLVMSIVAMVALPFLGMFLLVGRAMTTVTTTVATRVAAGVTLDEPLLSDELGIMLGLPAGVEVPGAAMVSQDALFATPQVDTRYVVIEGAADLGPVLKDHFQPTTWEEIGERMTVSDPQLYSWDAAALKEMPCHLREFTTEAGGKYEVYACYDGRGAKLYCTIKQISPPTTTLEGLPEFQSEPPDDGD